MKKQTNRQVNGYRILAECAVGLATAPALSACGGGAGISMVGPGDTVQSPGTGQGPPAPESSQGPVSLSEALAALFESSTRSGSVKFNSAPLRPAQDFFFSSNSGKFYSDGEGDTTDETGTVDIEGNLTGIYPYLGYQATDQLSFWGMAGYATGDYEPYASHP